MTAAPEPFQTSGTLDPAGLEGCVARATPKLEALRNLVDGQHTLLAQTHDYPDPDTIASALALAWLLREEAEVKTTIGYGGVIGRAENQAMIRVLNIRMRRTQTADYKKFDLIALLDTQPEVGNHGVPLDRGADIVFDHHFRRPIKGKQPAFFDVGGEYGATSTKLLELLLAAGRAPPTDLATALFYGIKSDTWNLSRDASPADLAAYLYLFPRADKQLLSEIEHPQVPIDYFRVLNTAMLRGKIHGQMIVSDLGEVYTPDLCAEVADRLLQVQGLKHALALGWHEEALFLSLRSRSRNRNAGKILYRLIAQSGLGTAGGHTSMAGARIPMEGRSQRARADVRRRIVAGVVEAFGQDPKHFRRLVPPKDARNGKCDPPPPRRADEDHKATKSGRTGGGTETKKRRAGDGKRSAS